MHRNFCLVQHMGFFHTKKYEESARVPRPKKVSQNWKPRAGDQLSTPLKKEQNANYNPFNGTALLSCCRIGEEIKCWKESFSTKNMDDVAVDAIHCSAEYESVNSSNNNSIMSNHSVAPDLI